MATDIEQKIYELVEKHEGHYLFERPVLTPKTDLDGDLGLDEDDANELMQAFFAEFNVLAGKYSIKTYYPDPPPLELSLDMFKTQEQEPIPDFTIGMLIESAKTGRWLFD